MEISTLWLSLDAIWFPDASEHAVEEFGIKLPARFPLTGVRILLCEAKHRHVTPALIGQALVHTAFARRAGALVDKTLIFANAITPKMRDVAIELGLEVIVQPSSGEPFAGDLDKQDHRCSDGPAATESSDCR